MSDSRTGAQRLQDESGISIVCQKVLKFSEDTEDTSDGQRNCSKGFPTHHIWHSLFIKMNNNRSKLLLNFKKCPEYTDHFKDIKGGVEGGKLLLTGGGPQINIEGTVSMKCRGNFETR